MFSTAFSFLHFPMGTKSNEYFAVCNSRHVCCAISIDFFQQIVLLWVVHCMSIKGNCYENHKAISVAIFPMKPDLNISTFRCWCCYICLNRNSMPLSFRVKCPGWFRVKCPGCSCKMSRMLQATTWSQGWGWTATAGVRGCRRCQATAKLGARTTGSPTSSAIRFVWGGGVSVCYFVCVGAIRCLIEQQWHVRPQPSLVRHKGWRWFFACRVWRHSHSSVLRVDVIGPDPEKVTRVFFSKTHLKKQ